MPGPPADDSAGWQRVEHDLSDEQWMALRAYLGRVRVLRRSDRPLQRDCVLAVSRGGRYTLDNVVPACGACNASKCNDEVTGWLRRRRLDERAFLLRHSASARRLGLQFRPEPAAGPAVPEKPRMTGPHPAT